MLQKINGKNARKKKRHSFTEYPCKGAGYKNKEISVLLFFFIIVHKN